MQNKKESIWSHTMTVKEQFHTIKRMLPFTKPFWKQFVVAIIFAGVVSVINILLPRLIQYYMDHFLVHSSTPLSIMFLFAGLYFMGAILQAIFQFGQTFLYAMGAERTLERVRVLLFRKLHKLGMSYFDATPAGSIVSRVTNDTMILQDFWTLFLTLIVGVFGMASALVAMFTTNVKITWATLVLLPFLVFIIWFYQKYSSTVYRRMRENLSQLNTKISESLVGIGVIQQFRQEKRIETEFEKTNNDYLFARFSMIRMNSLLLNPIINLMYALGVVIALGLFGINAFKEPVAAGVIYAFVSYIDSFYNPMSSMMDYLSTFQDGLVASTRILRIFDNENYQPKQNEKSNLEITEGKIEFKHVTFSYDGKNNVLNDINFTVNPGETVALVGSTGSGKSSTINLLMRFYEFQSGQILVDGHDIREYPAAELRKKIGLVLQEPFLFYGDIASNIRMYNDEITDDDIRRAAQFVQADHFIEGLPNGYHNKVIERGAEYSGGQRQLISFARTVVGDPKVLILDEATAHIDTEKEDMIQGSLRKMSQSRTSLVIAHRLSTIQDANQILVFKHGRIIERGTHDELLAKHGMYFDMYQLQGNTKTVPS